MRSGQGQLFQVKGDHYKALPLTPTEALVLPVLGLRWNLWWPGCPVSPSGWEWPGNLTPQEPTQGTLPFEHGAPFHFTSPIWQMG